MEMKKSRVIYRLQDGKFVQVAKPTNPNKPHFAIVWSDGAAWSPMQTLRQCQRQFPILERSKQEGYSVVER